MAARKSPEYPQSWELLKPKTGLGQHFLIKDEFIERAVSLVEPESAVIEVGSGPGNVTEMLIKRASRVIGIEIDRQFEPLFKIYSKKMIILR